MKGKIAICIILLTLSVGETYAGPKSAGASFSYGGIGLTYEHGINSERFAEIQLRAEMPSVFDGTNRIPGISASFTWNTVFADKEWREGNKVRFFAGPGMAAGFTEDMERGYGLTLGLKGRVGAECTFPRGISISISFSPVLGVHISSENGMLNMLMYRNGLLYGIIPEVGIKYAF